MLHRIDEKPVQEPPGTCKKVMYCSSTWCTMAARQALSAGGSGAYGESGSLTKALPTRRFHGAVGTSTPSAVTSELETSSLFKDEAVRRFQGAAAHPNSFVSEHSFRCGFHGLQPLLLCARHMYSHNQINSNMTHLLNFDFRIQVQNLRQLGRTTTDRPSWAKPGSEVRTPAYIGTRTFALSVTISITSSWDPTASIGLRKSPPEAGFMGPACSMKCFPCFWNRGEMSNFQRNTSSMHPRMGSPHSSAHTKPPPSHTAEMVV